MPKKQTLETLKYSREEQLRAIAMVQQLGSTSKASRALGISRTTLQYWQKTLGEEIRRDCGLQVAESRVSREVRKAIADAHHEFLNEHYSELSDTFKLAIGKAKKELQAGTLSAMQSITIAEKIANIIDTMSTAEVAGNTQVNNLLQFCINEVNNR